MNIQSVNCFDAAVQQLGAIKGDVTASQLSDLTALFSTQIWNTSDAEGTTATLDRQIQELEALLDEIQEDIEETYNEQKYANEELNQLVNDIDEESYQASKQQDKNIKEQQDLVTAATDEAYNAYMRGDIEKEEIPSYIATRISKGNQAGGAAMQSHLDAMDAKGQKITSLSNKIAGILDTINKYKAKYETTEASLGLLKKLKAKVPAKNTREDIETNVARPYFSPSQEALGDKLIDKYTVTATGDTCGSDNQAVQKLSEALQGSVAVTDARKAELDAMSPEAKAAAVEEADTSKYSALELMYLSGMDVYQAGSAIQSVFGNAYIKYNSDGSLAVPKGHDAAATAIYNELINQYKVLWGKDALQDTDTPEGGEGGGETHRTDPIGWRDGDTNYFFAVDRDGDNTFDGAEEFLGSENGWAEVAALDTNGDGDLTAAELAAGGVRVVEINQALTNGGLYGFNGVAESGVGSIDLDSYRAIGETQGTNINGNRRVAEFSMTVNGATVLGKQTEDEDAYMETFYSHMYGDVYSFGLDEDEVAETLRAAATPTDYTASERAEVEDTVADAQETIENDKISVENKEEELAEVNANATDVGVVADRPEESEETDEATETETTEATDEAVEPEAETAVAEEIVVPDEAEASNSEEAATTEELIAQAVEDIEEKIEEEKKEEQVEEA